MPSWCSNSSISLLVDARVDGLRLLDGSLLVKIERDGRVVQVRVTGDGPLLAGGGFRLCHD